MSSKEFTVVRCQDCGLLYLNPRPTQEEIGRFYPSQYFGSVPVPRKLNLIKRWVMEDFYGYPRAGSIGRLGRLRKWLLWPEKTLRTLRGRDILPWIDRGRLLDVGCGQGSNLTTFRDQGWDVYGLDASPVAVEMAQRDFGDRVQLGELGKTDYKNGSFDVVLFSHALEHMHDPLAILAEVRRILSDGGLLVITLPNAGSLEARLFGRWWFPWELPRHLYHFEKATLVQLLTRAGFRISRMRTGVGSLFFMTSLERIWTQRFGRALPLRWMFERLLARPFCLIAGHLGYGTEITVYAAKAESGRAAYVSDMNAQVAEVLCD